MAYDLMIYLNGNGSDFKIKSNDIESIQGITNQVLLAWFGGNVESDTTGDEIPTEQRFDYFANPLLFPEDATAQFNSKLERTLQEVALNSSGRIKIQRAAIDDLKYLSDIANIDVAVNIISNDKVQIIAYIDEPSNIENKELRVVWDATKNEIITEYNI